MADKVKGLSTRAVHAGQSPDPTTLSRGAPIYRTSSYVFKSVKHGADLFSLKEAGNIYSRLGNPTNGFLEERVTALEGGAASVAVASGTAAIFNTVITVARMGDELVSASNLYGGTYTMFDAILPNFGITTKWADVRDPQSFERQITERTRLVYVESIGNPGLDVADVDAIAAIAHGHHLPLVVDGTFTTPVLLRTIEHGADIVINSLTKWIGGHGTAIGGIATDAGSFDWSDPKFALFNEPDANYHGIRWTRDLPAMLQKTPFAVRFRNVPLRNLGACLSPEDAWVFLQGIESLPLRMAKHSENALAVAEYLSKHPRAAWVRYPGLQGDPSHSVAKRLLTGGFGGMVVFGVKGGLPAGVKFIEALRLFSNLANVGDAKSLAIHPASTTHAQLSEEQQIASGVSPDLIRLSIGIEDIADIIGDMDRGFAAT